MKSKISFFNLAIFKKDLLRFWPFWVLELAGLQLFVSLPLFSELSAEAHEINGNRIRDMAAILGNRGSYLSDSILTACLSILAATLIFSYLTQAKEAYTIHSFPMKRRTLFFSHYLAGLVMLVVPFAVTYLTVICIMGGFGWDCAGVLLGKMAVTLIEILLFYHLSCLVVMLTGNSIMSIVIFAVLNVLYAGLMYLFSVLGGLFIYGYPGEVDLVMDPVAKWLTPAFTICSFLTRLRNMLYYVDTDVGEFTGEQLEVLNSFWCAASLDEVVWYLVPAAVFLVLALVLYWKRPVEAAGDSVAFSWGRPVFRLVFTICGSVLFTLSMYTICLRDNGEIYTYQELFPVLLILLTVGCVLFYLVSNMILWRSFFIWKRTSYVRLLLVAAAAVGIMCYMKFGYGAGIPDVEQVEMLSLGEKRFTRNKQLIEQFMKQQREIIQYGEQAPVDRYDENTEEVHVQYTLKGGGTVQRIYPVLKGRQVYERYLDFINNKETICSFLFSEDYDKVEVQEMYFAFLDDSDESGETVGYVGIPDKVRRERLYRAILADLQEGSIIPQYTSRYGWDEHEARDALEIQIGISIPESVCKAGNYSEEYRQAMEERMIIVWMTSESEHTKKVIREDDFLRKRIASQGENIIYWKEDGL